VHRSGVELACCATFSTSCNTAGLRRYPVLLWPLRPAATAIGWPAVAVHLPVKPLLEALLRDANDPPEANGRDLVTGDELVGEVA